MRILFLTYEPWPTHRADVVVLFGKYLRRFGIVTDLVAEAEECGTAPATAWEGGDVITCVRPRRRPAQHLAKLWLNVRSAFGARKERYDCIQVRDMSLSALTGLIAARIRGIRFVYWLSFLQSEGHILRARARGPGAGLKYWYPLFEGMLGKFIVYKLVLPRADHIFVQSEAMKSRLIGMGVPSEKMTAVPMGVDLEESKALRGDANADPALAGRRPLIYLGIQDRERRLELLLEMLALVKSAVPDVVLIMAGDTADTDYRDWLRSEAVRLQVDQHIIWTGWVSRNQAWQYVRAAEIGLSPFPRGEVLDTCSPTKAVEYMALGVPVIGNDNPDQQQVIEASGAGICVPLAAPELAGAVISLLNDPHKRAEMSRRGPDYVASERSYMRLSSDLKEIYERVCGKQLKAGAESHAGHLDGVSRENIDESAVDKTASCAATKTK